MTKCINFSLNDVCNCNRYLKQLFGKYTLLNLLVITITGC